jgi:hypothetical protein
LNELSKKFDEEASKVVYATSNKSVDEWFPNATVEERNVLMRRIDSKTTYRWVEDGDVRVVKTHRELYQVVAGVDSPVPAPIVVEVPSRQLVTLATAAETLTPPPRLPLKGSDLPAKLSGLFGPRR